MAKVDAHVVTKRSLRAGHRPPPTSSSDSKISIDTSTSSTMTLLPGASVRINAHYSGPGGGTEA